MRAPHPPPRAEELAGRPSPGRLRSPSSACIASLWPPTLSGGAGVPGRGSGQGSGRERGGRGRREGAGLSQGGPGERLWGGGVIVMGRGEETLNVYQTAKQMAKR